MIYDEIFYCIPTDSVKSITDLKKYLEKTSLAKAETEDSSRAIEKIQVIHTTFILCRLLYLTRRYIL